MFSLRLLSLALCRALSRVGASVCRAHHGLWAVSSGTSSLGLCGGCLRTFIAFSVSGSLFACCGLVVWVAFPLVYASCSVVRGSGVLHAGLVWLLVVIFPVLLLSGGRCMIS